MNKYPLIGVSICAVVLLVLGSLTNVVGYQSVQSSNQKVINEDINQKDLLFQIILDIANNKEIQRIILKSQINRGIFPNPDVNFSGFNTPVLTKNQLKQMYVFGLLLSMTYNKSKIYSIVEQHQLINPETQKEINGVIEKNTILNGEISQLSNPGCDCEKDTSIWPFPILCTILLSFAIISDLLVGWGIPGILFLIGLVIMIPTAILAYTLHCWWL